MHRAVMFDAERFGNTMELARFLGYDSGLTARILRLPRLSPRIIHAALMNELPDNINVEALFRAFPTVWAEQEEILGFSVLSYHTSQHFKHRKVLSF